MGSVGIWVCALLCTACGVILLILAKKLSWAIGAGAPYGKRRVACIICGIITLLASVFSVVWGILSVTSDFISVFGI